MGQDRRRKDKYTPVKGNIIMGSGSITDRETPIGEVTSESGKVVIAGEVFKSESRTVREGTKLVSIFVTDKSTSICVKAFVPD